MATKRQKDKAAKNLADARALMEQAETDARAAGLDVETVQSAPVHGTANKKGSQTVFVGCKLPRGIMLQLHTEGTIDRQVMGGGIKAQKIFMRDPGKDSSVRLKGNTLPFGSLPNYPIVGGYGITEVSRAFFEKWHGQNPGMHYLLAQKILMVYDDLPDASAGSREHAEIRSGLEPLNPKGDPRADKVNSPNLSEIETDTDRDATKQAAA